jgi:hypothetical protein
MAHSQSLLQQIDLQLEKLFSSWSIYSTILAVVLVTYLLYPVFFSPDPDTHPLLLARQAVASQVRLPGESAIFRSSETPHTYPLRTGLNVKEPGAQKWMAGRDGDLKDVWSQTLRGPVDSDQSSTAVPGKILTVLGKEQVIKYELPQLAKHINIVQNFLKCQPGSSVAIYLPNSVEYLVAFFGIGRPISRGFPANDLHSRCFIWIYTRLNFPKHHPSTAGTSSGPDACQYLDSSSRNRAVEGRVETLFWTEAGDMGCGRD